MRLSRTTGDLLAIAFGVLLGLLILGQARAQGFPHQLSIQLYGVECAEPGDVPANEEHSSWDESGVADSLNHKVQTAMTKPQDIPAGCTKSEGWAFTFGTSQWASDARTLPVNGSLDAPLTEQETKALVNGGVWVRATAPQGKQFAALRCHDDVLFGDSLEVVQLPAISNRPMTCIAFSLPALSQPQVQAPAVVFLSVLCQSYLDVPANAYPDDWDETGHASALNRESNTSITMPSDIPDGCETGGMATTFSVLSTATWQPIVTYDSVTKLSATLPDAAAHAVMDGGVYVSAAMPEGVGFAGLRCHDDIIFGDSLELLRVAPIDGLAEVYCIAFGVPK